MAFYKYFFGRRGSNKEQDKNKEKIIEPDQNNKELEEESNLIDIDTEKSVFEFQLSKLLDHDYDLLGKNDAFSNPNSSYMDLGIKLLKAELVTSLLNLNGKVGKRIDQINAWIIMHKGLGQVDSVNRLEAIKKYLEEFVKRVELIKNGMKNGTGESARITISYRRGFIKGIEAISYSKFLKT